MMNKRFLLAALIATVFIGAAWFMDPFRLFLLGVVPLVWIGLPTALIATILLVVAIRTGRSRRPALAILKGVGGFAGFVALLMTANHFAQEFAVSGAKAYPARVAPLLEAYRQTHGAYPGSLDQLPKKPSVPRLMRDFGYQSHGQSYYFMFPQPGGLIDTWNYDSETKTWQLST